MHLVSAGTFVVELVQFIGTSVKRLSRCLFAAVNSKKNADDDDGEDDFEEEENEEEEEDKASRASRWPEHSSELRALPKAVQVCSANRSDTCSISTQFLFVLKNCSSNVCGKPQKNANNFRSCAFAAASRRRVGGAG